jgi:hypothetical protein
MEDNIGSETPSAWEEYNHKPHKRYMSKINDRKRFRGFSFWSKRNSLKIQPSLKNDSSLHKANQCHYPTLNPIEM